MSYPQVALGGLAVAGAVLLAAAVLRRPGPAWWARTGLVAAVLVVLTAVFDNVLIAADLVRYDEAALSGVFIGAAPVEDFAWALAAAVLMPALWELLTTVSAPTGAGGRGAGRRGAGQAPGRRTPPEEHR